MIKKKSGKPGEMTCIKEKQRHLNVVGTPMNSHPIPPISMIIKFKYFAFIIYSIKLTFK